MQKILRRTTEWQKVRVVYQPKVGKISDQTLKTYRLINLMFYLMQTLEGLQYRYIKDELLSDRPGKLIDLALNDRPSNEQQL
ncbi:hypothetical protein JTB14_034101 [Gonioctena quinquepunctata]|nr:hypothetical protein JTB14_034101 [Gonioctena quinquepunctata]